ncbi:DNA polymerase III subunit gamma/tau C-terminal domain-containing protein [Candidatus Regiella insecticola]|uniref:DNA polymerase III subunit gamma/tau C-terminal domain-containing protein n=1 Tax=Candidatus Regiella insecticola TaxID=138073 RepID=UPI00387E79FA
MAADSVLTKNVALKAVPDDNQQPRISSTPNQLDKNNTAVKKEAYRWKAQNQPSTVEAVVTLKTLRNALQYEKNPELLEKLAQEAINRDLWAAEINKLSLPKLVQQLALNTFKQTIESNNICLHLRSSQHHLNSLSARKTLAEALSHLYGEKIELNLIEDDDPAQRTPLEWRQTIYEEKLALARQSIKGDNNIQMLCHFFDAILDEESIQPI